MIKDFNSYIDQEYNKPKNCIILIGPPGSGKGTQASVINAKTGYDHISTGEILRNSKNSEVKKILKSGGLVSDNKVYKELEKYIKKNINSPGFILDGYPRNIKQKYYLDQILEANNLVISHIFYFNVSDKEIKRRIKERSKSEGRLDDNEKTLKNRIEEYKKQTLPLIDLLKKKSNFIEIRSDGEPSDVTKIIIENIPEI